MPARPVAKDSAKVLVEGLLGQVALQPRRPPSLRHVRRAAKSVSSDRAPPFPSRSRFGRRKRLRAFGARKRRTTMDRHPWLGKLFPVSGLPCALVPCLASSLAEVFPPRLRTSVPHSCPFSFSQLDAHKSKSTQLIYNRFSDTHFPTPCIYKTDAYQETKRTR